MSDELRDALTDISGIGDAKADDILELVAEHGGGSDTATIEEAIGHIEAMDARRADVQSHRDSALDLLRTLVPEDEDE